MIGVCVLIAGIWAGAFWGENGRLPLILSGAVAGVLALGLLTVGRRFDSAPQPSGGQGHEWERLPNA